MKKWETVYKLRTKNLELRTEKIIKILLTNRGLTTQKEIKKFLNPPKPESLTAKDVGINTKSLKHAMTRIKKALVDKESIVVYTDYDADGITAGTIMWETLHKLGAQVMPYTPHRVDEGYGLSVKGLDRVKEKYNPTLIITVDHGITAWEKVAYAHKLGIEVLVTDHHVKPEKLPDCLIVHTTQLSGAGVAYLVAKELVRQTKKLADDENGEMLALAAIGTIADMVPLMGANRSIAKYGLEALNQTSRIGLQALIVDAQLVLGTISTYHISHIVAPRLNAMGRLVHALDALRLLCTQDTVKAKKLAQTLGLTNRERQLLTGDQTLHAKDVVFNRNKKHAHKKLLFVADETYNQGVIGLVAGKLVEEFYRPAIVISKGERYSKASARSIAGFNIIETIRSCSDLLVDAGGHPMAAGFTIETEKIELLQERLEQIAEKTLTDKQLTRILKIDLELPLVAIDMKLWNSLQQFEPFGIANQLPVFVTRDVLVTDVRLVGREGKHLKLWVRDTSLANNHVLEAVAFGLGELFSQVKSGQTLDIAYGVDRHLWNGEVSVQLKIRDLHIPAH